MRWTDDTQMSIDLAESILEKNTVDQDHLAFKFSLTDQRYYPKCKRALKQTKSSIS